MRNIVLQLSSHHDPHTSALTSAGSKVMLNNIFAMQPETLSPGEALIKFADLVEISVVICLDIVAQG
jgi:hypothetical protein